MEKIYAFVEYLESKIQSIIWRKEFMIFASVVATIVSYHIVKMVLTFLKLAKKGWKTNQTKKQIDTLEDSTENLKNRLKFYDKMEQVIFNLYGKKYATQFKKIYTYLLLTKNPMGMLMYVYLTVGCYSIAYGVFLPGPYISEYNHYIIMFMMIICQLSFIKACRSEAGECDANTYETCRIPYDNLMYKPGVECTSCKIIKPARSKHCSVCKKCVPLFDHHCFWINTCVTQNNFGSFMFFVATHCVLVMYVAFLTFWCIRGEILNQGIIFEDLPFKDQIHTYFWAWLEFS